jgi:hypothetical protein
MLEELFQISEGNPGALTCVTGLVNGTIEDSVAAITIIPTIKKNQIYGTDLYVLWSDLSQRNYQLMAHLCKEVPSDLLKLASSKQDYSGIEMVKEYIESFQKSLVVSK